MAKAPVLATGFELPLEPRLPRIGSIDAVAVEERAATPREEVDQAGGEALRSRPGGPDDGSHDPRGRGHARQGLGAVLQGHPARSCRPERSLGGGDLHLSEPRADRGRAHAGDERQGGIRGDRVPVGPGADESQGRRGSGRRRAGRRRGRHGHRPRRVPLRPVREGLRRDRPGEGGVGGGAPQGDPRDGRARDVRQCPAGEPACDRCRRRLHQDVDRASSRRPRPCLSPS